MLTTHATARLPFGAPAGLLQAPAVLDPELGPRTAERHSCKRTGSGMVASENHAEDSIRSLTPTQRCPLGRRPWHATEAPAPIWKATA